jgi:hypothetical protein
MRAVSEAIPFTHSIEAARELADGAGLRSVLGLVGAELVVAGTYLVAGYALLRLFEVQGRRHATLERA